MTTTVASLGQGEIIAEDNPSERDYRRALQYEGSGDRIRRLLDKASRGEPIVVSVIGGSGALSISYRMGRRRSLMVLRTQYQKVEDLHPIHHYRPGMLT